LDTPVGASRMTIPSPPGSVPTLPSAMGYASRPARTSAARLPLASR
jgi:hypothetical protein